MPLTIGNSGVTEKYISKTDIVFWKDICRKEDWQVDCRNGGSIFFTATKGNETIYFRDADKPFIDGRKGNTPRYDRNHPFRRGSHKPSNT